MTPADRRSAAAAFAGAIVTGLACGVTSSWLVNLVMGLALGIPAGFAVWGVLTVASHVLGARA